MRLIRGGCSLQGNRRSHPLAADGQILDGIKLERELLMPLKNMSQKWWIRRTPPVSYVNPCRAVFRSKQAQSFRIEVMSFGFNMESPNDVRFLPSYYLPERNQTGVDEPVYDMS